VTPGQGGDGLAAQNANWRFKGDVVSGFDAHITKSVPFYAAAQDLVVRTSDFFVGDGSLIYDLGTSTGALALKLAAHHAHRDGVRVVGIDQEADMVAAAEQKLAAAGLGNLEFVIDDIAHTPLAPCDLIVAFYTLQFIRPRIRQQVFDRIYQALNWGGALVLFEKVRAPDARFQDIATALYTDFKLEQGYSPDEIVGKTRSLKGVLEPFSTAGNMDLLGRAGFVDLMSIFKYVSFEGVLAIK